MKMIKIQIVILIIGLSVFSCNREKSSKLDCAVFESGKGWGYKIVQHDKVYIYQPFIPGVNGEIPFKSKANAEKIGKLVLSKIKNNEQPIISLADLNKADIVLQN